MTGQPTDATRRTRLAAERTFLAWLRGGLAAIAVGIGAGSVVPGLGDVETWPYVVLGVGYVLLGVLLLGYGVVRQRAVGVALDRGAYRPLETRGAVLLVAYVIALGVMTIVVLIVVT